MTTITQTPPDRSSRSIPVGRCRPSAFRRPSYLIILAMIIALAACSGETSPTSSDSDPADASKTTQATSTTGVHLITTTGGHESTTTTTAMERDSTATTVPRDRSELDGVLETALQALGVVDPGWDEPHGAPYSALTYVREDAIYTLLATFVGDEQLAIALAFGDGAEAQDIGERTGTDGSTVLVRHATTEDGEVYAATIKGLCSLYDVWEVAIVDDPEPLIADVVTVNSAIECP